MNKNERLINWYAIHKRNLSFRKTRDPYKIWISEIVFQQTRITQGIAYYDKFVEEFSNVESLAKASEQEVLKMWEGLGYYSRARNLHFSAKYIYNQLNNVFPDNYQSLLELKGVGKYTAAAIASICYNEKIPALDGNALRVYSRWFNNFEDINSSKSFDFYFEKIKIKMPKLAGDYNQAIMELGATICLPQNPLCTICPVVTDCLAFKENTQGLLPIKKKKKISKMKRINYYIYSCDQKMLIRKREGKGIWNGLYEFSQAPLLMEKHTTSKKMIHKLTHLDLHIKYYSLTVSKEIFNHLANDHSLIKVDFKNIDQYPFPVPLKKFLKTYL